VSIVLVLVEHEINMLGQGIVSVVHAVE
jgi:hypothetical protein